jgi:hypothetical protein
MSPVPASPRFPPLPLRGKGGAPPVPSLSGVSSWAAGRARRTAQALAVGGPSKKTKSPRGPGRVCVCSKIHPALHSASTSNLGRGNGYPTGTSGKPWPRSSRGRRLWRYCTFPPRGSPVGAPLVAIVNQAIARRLWPGENPAGRRLVVQDKKVEVVRGAPPPDRADEAIDTCRLASSLYPSCAGDGRLALAAPRRLAVFALLELRGIMEFFRARCQDHPCITGIARTAETASSSSRN